MADLARRGPQTDQRSDAQRKLEALLLLAAARSAAFEDLAQRAYLAVLSDVPVDDVRATCFEIAKTVRPEYGPAMPDAGRIREACLARGRRRHELAEAKRARLLPERPVTPEQYANIKRLVAEAVERMKMRGDR